MIKAQNDPYPVPHFVATTAPKWSELQHPAVVDGKQAAESVSDVPHPKALAGNVCRREGELFSE